MYEVTVRAETRHPLAEFTRAHPSAQVTLTLEESDGLLHTHHLVVASSGLQRVYRELLEGPPGPESCRRLLAGEATHEAATFFQGPCTCGGARSGCGEMRRLAEELRRSFPGPIRLAGVAFRRGRATARLLWLEPSPPASMPGGPAVETLVRLPVGEAVDPAARRLDPGELETLRTAIRLGHYEKPRRCKLDDIARALGITRSAVWHRLHAIEQKAIRDLLAAQPIRAAADARPDEPERAVVR